MKRNTKKDNEMQKSWIRLCRDPRTTVDLLENAAYWESINSPKCFDIRMTVARHRSTSSELLATLSMVNHLPLQITVAGHENLSESTAGDLMRKQLRELRKALATNPKIPLFVMEKLSRDFKEVRMQLGRNPGLPTSIMKRMVVHKEWEVRSALAQNPSAPQKLLATLSQDKDERVRTFVAVHVNLPLAGLRQLAEDPASGVREVVLERALEEYPADRSLFQALAKVKPSTIAQAADAHLEALDKKVDALEKGSPQADVPDTVEEVS